MFLRIFLCNAWFPFFFNILSVDSRPANKVIVALVGVTAGILLLLVFLLAYRKRFGWFPLCSTGQQTILFCSVIKCRAFVICFTVTSSVRLKKNEAA